MLADDLKVLKDFFGGIPPAGNQINIIIIGNTYDLRQEIDLLQKAIREMVSDFGPMPSREFARAEGQVFYPEGKEQDSVVGQEIGERPKKRVVMVSDEERKARSERMKKMHEERRKLKDGRK